MGLGFIKIHFKGTAIIHKIKAFKKIVRADQRKTAMYRGSNRIQIAARVNIMHPKKFGDHHRDENMDYRRDGGVQKGNCDNYLHLAIHFSGQYPRAKIFCTRMFYFPVTH